ncbi:hypothetical protein OIU77_000392 [Salix suchowensis]|uniref:Ig-like domain-containing protein n=1 Tax=Salix suchowensis TaxID=1278906 RepID=A0ABQ9B7Q3_9ROSI|nr:hypothetical protein OIU77_000392 [Salix suchowensis]
MPRTTTLECPGCPPLRALTFDSLGLIKVTESRVERGIPQVVERWGDPDPSKCVLAASIDDRKKDPLLAVARKNGEVEAVNPLNGEIHAVFSNVGEDGVQPEDDAISGLNLFRRERPSGSCTLLTCTSKGNASMRSIRWMEVKTMRCLEGKVLKLIYGTLRILLKSGLPNLLLKIALGYLPHLGLHAQHSRVMMITVNLWLAPIVIRETAIKAVTEDQDGHTLYIGNGSGSYLCILPH